MVAAALLRWRGELAKVGLESGSMSPWLARALGALGFAVVCMDARRAADAIKSRRVKSDKADAYALAEMLRTGWYSAVHVKSEASHRLKALLGSRDQLVRAKRALGNQVRGVLRPFGIRCRRREQEAFPMRAPISMSGLSLAASGTWIETLQEQVTPANGAAIAAADSAAGFRSS